MTIFISSLWGSEKKNQSYPWGVQTNIFSVIFKLKNKIYKTMSTQFLSFTTFNQMKKQKGNLIINRSYNKNYICIR